MSGKKHKEHAAAWQHAQKHEAAWQWRMDKGARYTAQRRAGQTQTPSCSMQASTAAMGWIAKQ
eukprot:1159547-Pelagomonas_calceolata.AAC.1